MKKRFYEVELICQECGNPFWGRRDAKTCTGPCRSRNNRARKTGVRAAALTELCAEVLRRAQEGRADYSKLLPRLLRRVAADLRMRGWDPLALLLDRPDEPASSEDTAPGGIEGSMPNRRRWLLTPEEELVKLTEIIEERDARGAPTGWHRRRLRSIVTVLEKRERVGSPCL